MTYLQSIAMGVLQGVAEFLPISSSGHLALFQYFFGVESVESSHMFFSVLLHFGTFISVCIVYWRDILEMILGVFSLFSRRGTRQSGAKETGGRMALMIILGTLPLFLVLPVKGYLDQLFTNVTFISLALLATGFLLFFSDRIHRGRKNARTATMKDALIVGCCQAIAVVPGLSRSGTTISAGMLRGYDRDFAVRFSFLLSLPAVFGANLLELKDALEVGFDTALLPVYLTGVVVSCVVGYFAIRLVKLLAEKDKFGKFAYYCWAAGLISLVAGFVL